MIFSRVFLWIAEIPLPFLPVLLFRALTRQCLTPYAQIHTGAYSAGTIPPAYNILIIPVSTPFKQIGFPPAGHSPRGGFERLAIILCTPQPDALEVYISPARKHAA